MNFDDVNKGENKPQRSYYAIIPASVRYDEELTPNAKLLYGEITALCNEKGYCWATNSYFANLYQKDKSTIIRWLQQLEEKGYITRDVVYKKGSREIKTRYMQICDGGHSKNATTPICKNKRDNNTLVNTTSNNTKDIPYVEIINYLNQLAEKNYKATTKKTKELIHARWGEGFTLEDFKTVIENKVQDWGNDNYWNKFLRPTTLFTGNFEGYLNEKPKKKEQLSDDALKYRGKF